MRIGEVTKPLEDWVVALNFNPELKAVKTVSAIKKAYYNKTDVCIYEISGKKQAGEKMLTIKMKQQDFEFDTVGQNEEKNTYYDKSSRRLDELIKTGYKVKDRDLWIEADLKKNAERYANESKIDNWKESMSLEDFDSFMQDLSDSLNGGIPLKLKDYRLYDILDMQFITNSAKDTIETINEFLSR